ncbi:MAG TPA: hypothetical protein VKC65_05815 [Gaiellaceae bacterium]|nr:hypothetical protein [Gaiellaceae bacterium]
MQRLAVALSAAALVVALLGATPLGNAAEKTVRHVVRVAKPAKQARGPRGPRGYRGPRGFQGPPGVKGDKGELGGLPNAVEARNTNAVEISGTTSDTATTVLASGTLPAGKYGFTAQVSLHGLDEVVVSCQAQGPGSAGPRIGAAGALHVGTAAGAVRDGTLPLVFAATFDAPGSVYVKCWSDHASAQRPTATSSDLVALTIGGLSGP